jgi:hypothetical protein
MVGATRPHEAARARSAATSHSRPPRTSSTRPTAETATAELGLWFGDGSCSTTTARSTVGRSPLRSRSGRQSRRLDRGPD